MKFFVTQTMNLRSNKESRKLYYRKRSTIQKGLFDFDDERKCMKSIESEPLEEQFQN